ncbi:hypothetical protein [Modestobacter sp. VKM Ac-2983]|uniref:hypothetical protein n=1 Tax=Modestobacter sp. VKM Ac-2983 TaxID=3004137 RepID=UPI0022ABBABC|nr:hypothetical protein [Modestobacter sp. VKM Ac-2983]
MTSSVALVMVSPPPDSVEKVFVVVPAEAMPVTLRTAVDRPIAVTASKPAARRDGDVRRTSISQGKGARNAGRVYPEVRVLHGTWH